MPLFRAGRLVVLAENSVVRKLAYLTAPQLTKDPADLFVPCLTNELVGFGVLKRSDGMLQPALHPSLLTTSLATMELVGLANEFARELIGFGRFSSSLPLVVACLATEPACPASKLDRNTIPGPTIR